MFRGNKKIAMGLITVTMLAMPMMPKAVSLPAEITTTTTITEDIKLENDVVIKGNSKIVFGKDGITLDLNGHKIETAEDNNNYALANHAASGVNAVAQSVTIKDSAQTKGKIVCGYNGNQIASCVQNYGTMKIEGVTIEANWSAIKNEEGATLVVTDSNITSKRGDAFTVQTYGTSTFSNSTIRNTSSTGTAFAQLTYMDFAAKSTFNNSVIEGSTAISVEVRTGNEPATGTVKNEVTINDSTIKGGYNTSLTDKIEQTTLLSGNINAPLEYSKYATNGSKLTVNTNVPEGNYEIPNGVKIIIPENIVVNTDADFYGENFSDDTVEIKNLADYSVVENAVNKVYEYFLKIEEEYKDMEIESVYDIFTEESVNKLFDTMNEQVVRYLRADQQDQVNAMAQNIETALANLVKISDVTTNSNPKTIDNIALYITVAIVSIALLVLATKKILVKGDK